MLKRGEDLALRLAGAFSAESPFPQLVHIATDGETYGHHQPNGDMALTYALQYIESQKLARLTNYGEYLEKHTPIATGEIPATIRRMASFMRFLTGLGIPLPEPLPCTADFVLNYNLGRAFEQLTIDRDDVQNLLKEAATLNVPLNRVSLEFTLRRTLERLMEKIRETQAEFGILQNLEAVVSLAGTLPFEVNLWKVQNIYYEMLQTVLPEWRWKAEHGDARAHDWAATFVKLGAELAVKVD